jgi:phosphoglycolate phosphatase
MPGVDPRRVGIRAILFDKDGTLVDYAASWTPINARAIALAAGGDAALAERLRAAVGVDAGGRALSPTSIMAAGSAGEIAAALVAAGARFEPAALTRALDDLFLAGVDDMVAVGDLPAILGRLSTRGLALGVASSDNEASVRAMAERFGIADLLVFTAGWDSGHGAKPEAGIALAFAAVVGCGPREIAVVGDTGHDMGLARAAGAGLAIGVLTGTGTRESLGAQADLVIDSVRDLERALFE